MIAKRKVCVITGAAGGVGKALVHNFKEAGYRVIAIDSVPPPQGQEVEYFQLDLALLVQDPSLELINPIIEELSEDGIDVLINNAAIQVVGGVDELDYASWLRTLQVNVLAPFFLVKKFFPLLEKSKGSVINIGSIHSSLTKRGFMAYATSKSALRGLTRSLAIEVGDKFRVNAIEPAAIRTSMLEEGFQDKSKLDALSRYHPVGRIGEPEEVAKVCLFLASSEIGFLHGACINLDGGIGNLLHDPS